MPEQPYKPVACADYDIYEIAIMQHKMLILKWHDQSMNVCQHQVKPVALQIRDGAEYLLFEMTDTEQAETDRQEVRLDRVISAVISTSDV